MSSQIVSSKSKEQIQGSSVRGAKLISEATSPLKVQKYLLPSGITLIYHPEHSAPLVTYQTWYGVGSGHEHKGYTGIAHLFEHLMFKATTKYEEGEYDRILEEAGGQVNAATWLDWTYYYADVPSEALPKLIELEADRMQGLMLDSHQLEAERKVVINERKECVEDDPDAQLSEHLWHLMLGDQHPYGHPTIGWMDDIEKISLEDCQQFYRRFYAPDQAIIVVAGDVQLPDLIDTIEDAYGPLTQSIKTQSLREIASSPEQYMRDVDVPISFVEYQLQTSCPRLLIGLYAESALTVDSVYYELLDEVLFAGDSSRIYRELILEREWAISLGLSLPQFKGDSILELSMELHEGIDPHMVVTLIFDMIEQVAQEGLTDGEWQRAKNQVEVQSYRALQTLQQRGSALGFWETIAGDFRTLFARTEQIESCTQVEVQRVANELCDVQRRCVIYNRSVDIHGKGE